jgi:hypothetical protein
MFVKGFAVEEIFPSGVHPGKFRWPPINILFDNYYSPPYFNLVDSTGIDHIKFSLKEVIYARRRTANHLF